MLFRSRVLANQAITVHWNSEVTDVKGDQWLDSLTLKDRETETLSELKIRGLFYAIGHTPNTELLQGQLDLDDKGYIVTSPGRPETSREGVFAAGDVADAEWRQGITAAGSGCQAALAAERWLSRHNLAHTVKRDPVEPIPSEKSIRTVTSDREN